MRKFVISGPKHSSMTFNKSRALQVVGQNFVIRFCNGCKHVFPYFFGVKQWNFEKMKKRPRDTATSILHAKFQLPSPSRCWVMATDRQTDWLTDKGICIVALRQLKNSSKHKKYPDFIQVLTNEMEGDPCKLYFDLEFQVVIADVGSKF